MLKSIYINNYALIDEVTIAFSPGFTVLTGETGAGKSIILGALSLIVGQRADSSVLRDKEQKCVVEVTFDITDYGLESLFEENDVDFAPQSIIRREILPNGKTRAFVNDTPVNLNFIKDFTASLIDIHSQHQNLLLGDNRFQLKVVDEMASTQKLAIEVKSKYQKIQASKRELERIVADADKQKSDLDYITFQLTQLVEANLIEGEQESLEEELSILKNGDEITLALNKANQLLSISEFNIAVSLKEAIVAIRKISNVYHQASEFETRLNSVAIEIADLSTEIEKSAESVHVNPERLQFVEQRLDLLFTLMQKHRVLTVAELIAHKQELTEKLQHINSFDAEIECLQKEIKVAENELITISKDLSTKRKSVFASIEKSIADMLHTLGMPHAIFQVNHQQLKELSENGLDEIRFLFSANKNGQLTDILKVASGGELSRLMLAIKSLLSNVKGLPTIIFDEIDTGVSGEIADRMGEIMHQMSKNIQVLSITHLPQIAGKGDVHFKVYKSDDTDKTSSHIKVLTDNERIEELAKILSGKELTSAALENAKHLLQRK